MKRSWPFAALALSAIPLTATADPAGGFVGPDARKPPITVVEAAALGEDTSVRLVGFIVKSLGDERYEFSDETGTLVVEIDDDDWNGVEVTPNDHVELAGEIDRDDGQVELDVDSVRAANP